MYIGVVQKQPGERKDRDVLLDDYFTVRANDTVISVDVSSDDPTLTVQLGQVDHDRFKVWFEGGDDGKTYKTTCVIETSMGRVIEAEIRVRVKEI